MSAAAGGMVGMSLSYWRNKGHISVGFVSNGILAGLVSVTASAPQVAAWQAVIIGTFGALLCLGSISLFARMGIDDPISAVSVHGVSGAWGTIAVGIFSHDVTCGAVSGNDGILYGSGYLLGVQSLGLLIVISWSVLCTLLFLCFFHYVLGINLRVPPEEEIRGLDAAEHGVDDGIMLMKDMRFVSYLFIFYFLFF